jgi:hypothetical protein
MLCCGVVWCGGGAPVPVHVLWPCVAVGAAWWLQEVVPAGMIVDKWSDLPKEYKYEGWIRWAL